MRRFGYNTLFVHAFHGEVGNMVGTWGSVTGEGEHDRGKPCHYSTTEHFAGSYSKPFVLIADQAPVGETS